MRGSGFHMNLGVAISSFNQMRQLAGGADAASMQSACQTLQTEIQRRAPVDTGHLRASYDIAVESSRGGGSIGFVGTNTDYAIYQEYGTRYQSGTPHVRPAVDAVGSRVARQLAEDALKRILGG